MGRVKIYMVDGQSYDTGISFAKFKEKVKENLHNG